MLKEKLSYRMTTAGGHTHLGVWVNGGKAGELTVRNDEIGVLNMLVRALEKNGARDNTGMIGGLCG